MKIPGVLLVTLLASFATSQIKPEMKVRVLPPEQIPSGTCKESEFGYLSVAKNGKDQDMNLTDAQIGEYIRVRMGQGYSVTLYPQLSGRVFVIAECERKP